MIPTQLRCFLFISTHITMPSSYLTSTVFSEKSSLRYFIFKAPIPQTALSLVMPNQPIFCLFFFSPEKRIWKNNGEGVNLLCKVWTVRREKRALAYSWKRKVAACLFYGRLYLAIIILCCRWRAVNRCLWSHSMAIAYLAVAPAQARKRIQRCWGMTTGTNISWA